jgi:putative ABC transport system ATP-binding protein
MIRLEAVSKNYPVGGGLAKAVDSVDLEVPQGQFLSIIGPSGSGKTSILNLMAGLDDPDSGRVLLEGVELGKLRDRDRARLRLTKVGFVFQSFNLIPSLTVAKNVGWALGYLREPRSWAKVRVAEVLSRVGLEGLEARYPAELSGGEQQRVAIARALATGPKVLLADEPTGNLDSETGQRVLDLLGELNRTERLTIVMVTHNLIAAAYGHRTVELRDGRIARDVHVPEGDLVRLRLLGTE